MQLGWTNPDCRTPASANAVSLHCKCEVQEHADAWLCHIMAASGCVLLPLLLLLLPICCCVWQVRRVEAKHMGSTSSLEDD